MPMIRPSQWFEYVLCRKSQILLGGFAKNHPATPGFLQAFWDAYRGEEPQHVVFQDHANDLQRCVPFFLFNDEGRGHRKTPIQVVALESVFNVSSFKKFEKLKPHPSTWTSTMFQEIQQHTGSGSSYLSRILLYVLPHNLYKGKTNRLWDLVMDTVTRDMEQLFHHGVQVDGATFYPVLIGAKGDAPALVKLFKLSRSFTRWQGQKGVCMYCLAGQQGLPWEDLTKTAAWRATQYTTRPWSSQHPPGIAAVPFSAAPERCIRSDLMHLVKLGIGRHFLASAIVCLGEWAIFPDGEKSVQALFDSAHEDFEFCCKHEIHQTANLKQFTKDLFHWSRRSAYPWGGFSSSSFSFPWKQFRF